MVEAVARAIADAQYGPPTSVPAPFSEDELRSAAAAIKVIRDKIETAIPEIESHYCDCEYCGKSMREDILEMLK